MQILKEFEQKMKVVFSSSPLYNGLQGQPKAPIVEIMEMISTKYDFPQTQINVKDQQASTTTKIDITTNETKNKICWIGNV